MFIYSFFSLFQDPFVIIFKTAQETKTQKQNRQRAMLFLQSTELGPPPPSPTGEWVHPFFFGRGGAQRLGEPGLGH
jgi:hypothetical protein